MQVTPVHEQHFWAKVDRSGGPDACWKWLGAKTPENYGLFTIKHGWAGPSHRFVYELLVGPIPPGLQIDHTCHTNSPDCDGGSACPHRLCTNPAHLEPVTCRENFLRSRSKIASNNRDKTHCPAGHAYDEANTYWVPNTRTPHRRCKTCARIRKRKQPAA